MTSSNIQQVSINMKLIQSSPGKHGVVFLELGDTFIEVVMDETLSTFPAGFYYIPPHMVHYREDTNQYGIVGTDILFEDDELLHPQLPDMTNEWWGKSPIDKIAGDITADILSWKFNRDYFREGMHPRNVLKFNPNEVDKAGMDDEIERMQTSAKTGNTLITYGEFRDMALSNKDMEFGDLIDRVRDRIPCRLWSTASKSRNH